MDKLIQTKGYCKNNELDCLTLYKELPKNDKTYNVVLIESDASYKEKLIILNQLLATINNTVSLNIKEYKGQVTEDNIHITHANMLRALGNFIGYFTNCSSFRDAETADYDNVEFTKRLEQIKNFIK